MSVYDSNALLSYKAAAREFDVPVVSLELAVANGSLRSIEQDGEMVAAPQRRTIRQTHD